MWRDKTIVMGKLFLVFFFIFCGSRNFCGGSYPFSTPKMCNITKAELDNLLPVVENMINNSDSKTLITTEISDSLNSRCPQLSKLKTSLQNLAQFINDLKKYSTSDFNYEELKVSYEISLTSLKKETEDLKRHLTQELQENVNILEAKLQTLVNELINQIMKNLTVEIMHVRMNLIVSLIDNRQYDQAFKQLKNLNKSFSEKNVLEELIEQAFNEEGLVKLLNFIDKFENFEEKAIGLNFLLILMEKNKLLSSPAILVVHYILSRDKMRLQYKELESKLNVPLDKVLSAWANTIRSGLKFDKIIEFCKIDDLTGNAVLIILPDLLSKSHESERSILQRELIFLKSLPWKNHTIKGHEVIVKQMEKDHKMWTTEAILLAFSMYENEKKYDDNTVYINLWPKFKKILRSMQNISFEMN
jgi:hypothetical protein